MTTAVLAKTLLDSRQSRPLLLPEKARVHGFADELLGVLFPHFSTEDFDTAEQLDGRLRLLERDLKQALRPLETRFAHRMDEITDHFFDALPSIYDNLRQDAEAILQGDPAAESVDEVITAYPGFLAIAIYRVAHEFYRMAVPIFPRILTEYAHGRTGVDIHPGARIGSPFFIDHGTGIVIGETSLIGRNVKIYQGVTLGALSVSKDMASTKRHPTIEDNTVIYSGATILGGNTVVGHDSVIGGNVWLTESVGPYSIVYHHSDVHVRDSREQGDRSKAAESIKK